MRRKRLMVITAMYLTTIYYGILIWLFEKYSLLLVYDMLGERFYSETLSTQLACVISGLMGCKMYQLSTPVSITRNTLFNLLLFKVYNDCSSNFPPLCLKLNLLHSKLFKYNKADNFFLILSAVFFFQDRIWQITK